ncbi:MAG: hypothetical protein M3Q34_03445 [bacterium]|nr:hypothetical protein [bacterium]
MKKLQDMVPSRQTKKNIPKEKVNLEDTDLNKTENIKPSAKNASNFLSDLPKIKHETSSYKYDDGTCEVDVDDKKNNKGSRYSLWIVALVSIVFLFFSFSSIFAKAKVVVDPKVEDIPLYHDFSAFKDTNNEEVLPFSLVSLSDEVTKLVQSSEEKESEQQAKGKVMLYNSFSTTPQRLAKDTRLVGTNDKIYKTEIEITIPGMVKASPEKGIKQNLPGSVEVNVYASESGEEYNTRPIDFKILGFKGTNKYDALYGRSKGDIAGGLKGKFNFISTEDKTKVENELKTTLEDKLLKKITEEIPEGYVLLKNATIFKTDDKEMSLVSKDKEVPFVLRGTLYGFLFEEKSLTKKIVETVVPDYDNSEVYITNIKDVAFTTTLPAGTTSYLNVKDIDFNLSGTPKIVWKVDEEKLRNSLLSKSKDDFNQILAQFTNIDKANLTLRPIWRRNIPGKSKDVKIIVNY